MRRLRRTRFLVEGFQGRLVVVSFLYFGAILLTFAAAIFLPLVFELENNATSWHDKQQASAQFLALHQRLWPAVVALFVMLSIHTVLISHRVAGPLLQFRRAFRSIAAGDLSLQVRIRRKDYLTKEVREINDMIDSLRGRIEQCVGASDKAVKTLEPLRRAAATGTPTEIGRLVGHLEAQLVQLQEGLDFFRTGREEEASARQEDVSVPVPEVTPTVQS